MPSLRNNSRRRFTVFFSARFPIFLIPGNGGLQRSIRAVYWWAYDHIYTCYPRLTNCYHRHKLEYIFSDSKSIIYLFVLTPSVYPPYLLSYQHCSLINRLTFTLSWNSIDIIVCILYVLSNLIEKKEKNALSFGNVLSLHFAIRFTVLHSLKYWNQVVLSS